VSRVKHDGARANEQTDTTPRARERYLARLRETPGREKLQRAFDLSARVRGAVMAELERSMPLATKDELAVAFLRRLYGDELADKFAARRRAR